MRVIEEFFAGGRGGGQTMIVRSTDVSAYIVSQEASIKEALAKIDSNKKRLCFVVNGNGLLMGSLSDGDVRRHLLKGGSVQDAVISAFNPSGLSMPDTATRLEIKTKLSQKTPVIPLVDGRGQIKRVAHEGPPQIEIAGRPVGPGYPCFVIAEVGNNHNGQLENARKLVDFSAAAGADCVKFQLRRMDQVYRKKTLSKSGEDLGTQYTLDLLDRFQLTPEQMAEIAGYVRSKGLVFMCTPWDRSSVDFLEGLGVPAYKVASADFTNIDLIRHIVSKNKPVILSTGMSTPQEIESVVNELESLGAEFALLHCNSTYPAPVKDIHLRCIDSLKAYEAPVGYSGHERGIAISLAAVAMGACLLERHITLDRNWEGVDHKASLLPDEFRQMVAGAREIELATGEEAGLRRLSQGEMMNRENLGKSVVALTSIRKGQVITEDMLDVKSPGRGLSPLRKKSLVGIAAPRDMEAEDFFFETDLLPTSAAPRTYRMRRPWGLAVRYHDFAEFVERGKPDFVEFHFSYRDLDEDAAKHIGRPYDMDFIVHAPEHFQNDHLLDLCSPDEAYRKQSVAYLQKVVDLTRRLQPFFKKAEKPKIVVHVGGFTTHKPLAAEERPAYYDRLVKSVKGLSLDGVELLPENMPPFPWLFGGQRYQNILVLPQEIEKFCGETKLRLCFDCSHSKLTCNKFGIDQAEFARRVAPHTAHMHVADASGVDGEGIQIGEGENDFANLSSIVDKYTPRASFIPEVWQGHKNAGEGFWIALDRLEKWF